MMERVLEVKCCRLKFLRVLPVTSGTIRAVGILQNAAHTQEGIDAANVMLVKS